MKEREKNRNQTWSFREEIEEKGRDQIGLKKKKKRVLYEWRKEEGGHGEEVRRFWKKILR